MTRSLLVSEPVQHGKHWFYGFLRNVTCAISDGAKRKKAIWRLLRFFSNPLVFSDVFTRRKRKGVRGIDNKC